MLWLYPEPFCCLLQDWDKPEHIPDPDAKKPEDWDEEMDGEWEPPVIQNPEYKVRPPPLLNGRLWNEGGAVTPFLTTPSETPLRASGDPDRLTTPTTRANGCTLRLTTLSTPLTPTSMPTTASGSSASTSGR